jgi:hypothetical protein
VFEERKRKASYWRLGRFARVLQKHKRCLSLMFKPVKLIITRVEQFSGKLLFFSLNKTNEECSINARIAQFL